MISLGFSTNLENVGDYSTEYTQEKRHGTVRASSFTDVVYRKASTVIVSGGLSIPQVLHPESAILGLEFSGTGAVDAVNIAFIFSRDRS